jgi:hypothetical protein
LDVLVRAFGALFVSALPDVTMLQPYFWKLMLPAIERYRQEMGCGVKAPEIPTLPDMHEPFTEPLPEAPAPVVDNVIPINTPNQFAAIAAANADLRRNSGHA